MDAESVLITGCSSGIGEATARAFLEEDWTVYATARDVDDLRELADAGCTTVGLDVTDDREVAAAVERVHEDVGHLDCLVNNAGYAQLGPVEDVPVGAVQRQYDANVFGPHRLIRAALPAMRQRGEGTIVNVSSAAGRVSFPGGGAYCGSKAALRATSDALRAEVAGFGVDVVLVEPGPVATRFADRAGEVIEHRTDGSSAYASLYRMLEDTLSVMDGRPFASEPEDVAAAILNAASSTDPEPRYTVGAVGRAGGVAGHLPGHWIDTGYRVATKLVNVAPGGDDEGD